MGPARRSGRGCRQGMSHNMATTRRLCKLYFIWLMADIRVPSPAYDRTLSSQFLIHHNPSDSRYQFVQGLLCDDAARRFHSVGRRAAHQDAAMQCGPVRGFVLSNLYPFGANRNWYLVNISLYASDLIARVSQEGKISSYFEGIGSAGRTRTYNPRINSALLHH